MEKSAHADLSSRARGPPPLYPLPWTLAGAANGRPHTHDGCVWVADVRSPHSGNTRDASLDVQGGAFWYEDDQEESVLRRCWLA
jgi:hypothetical protein